MMTVFSSQLEKIKKDKGFIAALDQSGGSTPKALRLYGVEESAYSNDDEMFSLVHKMRTRIMTNQHFNGKRVLGAILFENTLDREVEGKMSSKYLWEDKQVVPFLKVDKGLAEVENDVQLMKDMPALDALLDKARKQGVFGTKMRSVIKMANKTGIQAVVEQQFAVAKQILAAGLVPIVEPEVDINSPQKAEAEQMLRDAIVEQLNALNADQQVMLKLTLPESDNFYCDVVSHEKVLKVVALSGGYSREEANRRTNCNNGVIASFSRALTEGLSAQQSDSEFGNQLDSAIESIYQASIS